MARRELTPEQIEALNNLSKKKASKKELTKRIIVKSSEPHWCNNCGSYFLSYDETTCQICGSESYNYE